MDSLMQKQSSDLRKLTSDEAANWLIKTYPIETSDVGEAIALLPHRSWKRADQIRLCKYYFQKIPFANSKVYEAFASFMSIDLMIKIVEENLPTSDSEVNLLLYYLTPTLKKHSKSTKDNDLINQFLDNRGGEFNFQVHH